VSLYDSDLESEKNSYYGDESYYSDDSIESEITSDYSDEVISSEDSINMRKITFKMPGRFTNSRKYL